MFSIRSFAKSEGTILTVNEILI